MTPDWGCVKEGMTTLRPATRNDLALLRRWMNSRL